jgi:hypothetical protein
MSFCTVICCIDGRVQLPVITYLQNRFGVDYVDNVTEAGPVGVLTQLPNSRSAKSIFQRVDLSVNVHSSTGIAIVAHHDCAGNPIPDSDQILQLQTCLETLSKRYPQLEVVGLWLDQNWAVYQYKI